MKDRQDRREHLLIPIVIPWMVNAARYHGARFNAIEYSVPSRVGILLHESTIRRNGALSHELSGNSIR